MPKMSPSKLIKTLNIAQGNDWQGLAEELQAGTDRAAAILGGVFLDEHLRRLISNFVVDEKEILDGLFEVEQPIATFSSRIKMSYTLGLINKQVYGDLNKIRNIRNVFAHALHGVSFDHDNIREWCKDLEMPKQLIPAQYELYPPRMLYISGVLFVASYLQSKAEQIGQHRRTVPNDFMLIHWNPVGNPADVEPNNPYIAIQKSSDE
jgi:DNA-binding MltR family transcriptional regulator